MTYPELINEYLDGKLAGTARERELFDGLAEHPEWREEMALQLQMEQAMRRDLSMVAVPPAATNAIFSRLRFTPSKQRSGLAQTAASGKSFFGRSVQQLGWFGALRIPALALAISGAGYLVYSTLHTSLIAGPSSHDGGGFVARTIITDTTSTHTPTLQSDVPAPSLSGDVVAAASAAKENVQKLRVDIPDANERSIGSTDARSERIPNEPILSYLNVGNFYAVHYLTSKKVIGIFEAGKIYSSQDGGHAWSLQSSGTNNVLYGVDFIDTLTGSAVGGLGTVLHTTDAGRHWETVSSGTDANLISVHYVTADTVYACGEDGAILRSTNGGSAWTPQVSGTTANLQGMQWKNGAEGEIRGAHGMAIRTHDAGATWQIVK